MQKILFKNGRLVNIETGEVDKVDIEVEDGVITRIERNINFNGQIVDLCDNFVLPNFVNVFCHSFEAFKQNYGDLQNADSETLGNIHKLMIIKNLLAGAFCNDVAVKSSLNSYLLTNIEEMEEKELSNASDFVAKNKSKLFIKAGQTLQELGTIDKTYHKPLSQVLEDFGFLDRQPVIVGGNCFEKDELQLFGQYGCDFCLTLPEDNKFGRRVTNLIALKMQDFCVGMGSGYNFEIDFFAFMRQLLLTQRALFEDESCVSESDALKIATYCGAKILTGNENAVKVGNSADFIVVRRGETLYDDILKSIVWEKSKKDVALTIKNGQILQKNGEILMKNLPNYDKMIAELRKFKEKK
ncbi:MAG: amidohydrolase family protein [Candidatus Caccovivens sp.]